MIKSAKGVIVLKDNYLLQLRDKQKDIYYPNFWGLFGGQIGKTETSKKALEREILTWIYQKEQLGTGHAVQIALYDKNKSDKNN